MTDLLRCSLWMAATLLLQWGLDQWDLGGLVLWDRDHLVLVQWGRDMDLWRAQWDLGVLWGQDHLALGDQ